jgi:hypothetical protein
MWLPPNLIYYFTEFQFMCSFYYVARPTDPRTLDINTSAINKQMRLRCILLQSRHPFEVRRILSSGIRFHVVRWKSIDTSEEYVASIFRNEEYAKPETSNSCLLSEFCWYLTWLIFEPWSWRLYVPPERRLNANGLQDFMFQKIKLFIIISVRKPNLHLKCTGKGSMRA